MSVQASSRRAAVTERRRYRGLRDHGALVLEVLCGESGHIEVGPGTLVSVTSVDGGGDALLTAQKRAMGRKRGFWAPRDR